MTSTSTLSVGLGDDFLLAYGQLPKTKQKKVREFIEKFRENPTSSGLNYEKIKASADPNLRSLRIDQEYRAIVLKPESGDVYLLLWVDKHDDAYSWAMGRTCRIHPETGTLQVVKSVPEPEQAPTSSIAPQKVVTCQSGLFDAFTRKELAEVGVPEEWLDRARQIKTELELDQLTDDLPADAYEALLCLAAGFSLDETKVELGLTAHGQVDTTDFAAAMTREASRRRFVVITEDSEMANILSYPLDRWRIFLHPSQRRLVEINAKGPVRVLGGAGTGKTVVAIHRAKWLAENACEPHEKILFTTFTTNLAADIQANLRKLCSHEALTRIEVVNLDAWVRRFLKAQGFSDVIDYREERTTELWQQALTAGPVECTLNPAELREEWEQVVQEQDIKDQASYVRARRVGAGKRLSREHRIKAWPVFEEYRTLLRENGVCEPADAIRKARAYIESQKLLLPYRAVVVDEGQDFSSEAYRLIRAMVPPIRAAQGNDLFIVGDAHQRIYGRMIVLSHCGIDVVGRSRKLRINYRTTEETRAWAHGILKGCTIDDLDGGVDDQRGYKSLVHGEPPLIVKCDSEDAEIAAILQRIQDLRDSGGDDSTICVTTKTHARLDEIKQALKHKGIPAFEIGAQQSDNTEVPGIRLATMHRVKGIEFDHVILAAMNSPFRPDGDGAANSRQIPLVQRCLVYVAATRARMTLMVTVCNMVFYEES